MVDHVEDRKKDVKGWSVVQEKVILVLQKILSEDDICESVLHKLYGIICTNCVTLEDRICLYPVLSMINHSCVANSCYTFNTETNSVLLRAKRPLEADLSWVLALMIPFTTAALGSPPAKPEALERCVE